MSPAAAAFPRTLSLYQGTKTIDNVESALKPGGTLVLDDRSAGGRQPAEYFDWSKNYRTASIEQRLREAFTVAGYIFFLNCEQAQRYRIFMYSSIDPQTVAPMGIHAFSDMDALLKAAELDGKSTYIIPNGSTVIPSGERRNAMRPVKSYIAKRFQNSDAGLSLDTDALARYSDIIDLSIGDTDFITDDAIIDTAFREAKAGYTHYGDPKGDPG